MHANTERPLQTRAGRIVEGRRAAAAAPGALADASERSELSRWLFAATEREVKVTLTRGQVLQACADAGILAGADPLLEQFAHEARAAELHELLGETKDAPGTPMSSSFIRGLVILSMLPADGSSVGVTRLAERLSMAPSTVHRYLTTLVAVGLARQVKRKGEYSRSLGQAY